MFTFNDLDYIDNIEYYLNYLYDIYISIQEFHIAETLEEKLSLLQLVKEYIYVQVMQVECNCAADGQSCPWCGIVARVYQSDLTDESVKEYLGLLKPYLLNKEIQDVRCQS